MVSTLSGPQWVNVVTTLQLGSPAAWGRYSVNEKHLSGNTFSTCWNVTTTQIILKDKDDIDALCPTDSSPK